MSTNTTQSQPTRPGYFESTADRLRAYLASMRQLRGAEYSVEVDEQIQRGRALIERLALSAKGEESPALRLAAAQCADVVSFVANSEPIDHANWFKEPTNAPSHLVGLMFVLEALEDSLRAVPSLRTVAIACAGRFRDTVVLTQEEEQQLLDKAVTSLRAS